MKAPRLITKLLINNAWVDAVSGKTFDVYNPATGEVCAKVAEADVADVDAAAAAARQAFKTYRLTDGAFRRNLLIKLANLIEANKEDLAAVETLDNGKPLWQSLMDMGSVQSLLSILRRMGG